MKVDKQQLVEAIYHTGAVRFEPHTLSSGLEFPIYISLRQCVSTPIILTQLADALWAMLGSATFDSICGIPYGAIPMASYLATQYNIPMLLLRKERKNYAEKSLIDGIIQPQSHCLLVDDFITTGNTMHNAIEQMQAADIKVSMVATIIDTELGGTANIRDTGIQVMSLFTFKEFCDYLLKINALNTSQRSALHSACELVIEN
ncbi:MAG: phosphoribosyltransferase family protein [Coxiellaceae bacterium]|nr:phosphoribosyltransferase family protein [Coxiellaceae bacterium]